MRHLLLLTYGLLLVGCAVKPKYLFQEELSPPAPDYALDKAWAALPDRLDLADCIPDSVNFSNEQATAMVDVFFLHPTTHTGKRGGKNWNGSLENKMLNLKTDESAIKYQSSIFNGVGRVYAPRYRQAHYHSYFTEDKRSAQAALDLAYADVRAAFQYFLTHYNDGRPIILAGHSQGAQHAFALLKEFFDNKPLKDRLVVAYLVGMPIPKNGLSEIPVCQDANDTHCFCSWRSFKNGHIPKETPMGDGIGVTNPLNWTTTDAYAPATLNQGGILRKFEGGLLPRLNDAVIHDGLLWVSKPDFAGSIFITFKNYHIADFNLFYANVRSNAAQRAQQFLSKSSAAE